MARVSLHTELCDILGIKYPIIQAGMGGLSGPSLAAAVSNAGGLGVLGCTTMPPQALRSWIRKTRELTDRPFGVDILMPIPALPAGAESGTEEELWALVQRQFPRQVEFVEQLRKEYGVPEMPRETMEVTTEFVRSQFEVVLEEKVAVFCSGLGTPDWVTPEAHAHGIKVVSLVGNVRNAIRMNEQGQDVIVAQGYEAGGHTGRIGTMALVPQVVDAVAPTPVVAAGGIGDGRGLVAALALGAVGVWAGTAFLLAEEILVEEVAEVMAILQYTPELLNRYQQRLINSNEENSIISRCVSGKTLRILKHEIIDKWEKSGLPTIGMPLQTTLMSNLVTGLNEINHPIAPLITCAGQITGMFKKVRPAKQIVEEMVEQASAIIG